MPLLLILLWFFLPIPSWMINRLTGKRIHPVLLYFLVTICGYLSFVSAAWLADIEMTAKMNSFDLDGDGGIGGDEMTPEAQEAMDDWANDTGRTLAPFIGGPVTAIFYLIQFVFLWAVDWILRRLFGRQIEPKVVTSSDHPNAPPSHDTGNPFQPPQL